MNENELHKHMVTLEIGRIVDLSKRDGQIAARSIIADDIVKLRAENERLKTALAAAESKHAEEMRSVEAENPILHEGVESVAERAKWTFAMQASEIRRLTARLSSLESRHAEEMREGIAWAYVMAVYDWTGGESEITLGPQRKKELVAAFLATRQSHSGTENVPSGDRKDKT